MVDYSIADDVAEIVLNDPGKLNALDEAALADLSAAFTTRPRTTMHAPSSCVAKAGRSARVATSRT